MRFDYPPVMRRATLSLLLPVALASLTGCLERTVKITSEPQGAIVWLNDQEIGRTPVEADFTYFGDYSVQLRREGYEPVSTVCTMKTPIKELPVVDLAAEAMPARFRTNIHWHFDLVPVAETTLPPRQAEQRVVQAGRAMREQLEGFDASAAPGDAAPQDEPASATSN